MSKGPTLVTKDFTEKFDEVIKRFRHDKVLVGIPSEDSNRKSGEDAQINNAALLAINVFGSPVNNIPARDVMSIGIKNAQPAIEAQFKKAAQDALKRGFAAITMYYERVGIIASNSIKKAINDQDGIDGPSEATLAARRAQGFSGTKALVVTGQMRNAITYVVKGG